MKWREYKFKAFHVERSGITTEIVPCITEKINSDLVYFGRIIGTDIKLNIKWYRSAAKQCNNGRMKKYNSC
jgi:hypothetical protein